MKRKAIQLIILLLVSVVPAISFAQPGPGNGGPEGVPFDDNMNLVFLVAGIVFAVMVTIKQLRGKVAVAK
jgi:hypothetical protein